LIKKLNTTFYLYIYEKSIVRSVAPVTSSPSDFPLSGRALERRRWWWQSTEEERATLVELGFGGCRGSTSVDHRGGWDRGRGDAWGDRRWAAGGAKGGGARVRGEAKEGSGALEAMVGWRQSRRTTGKKMFRRSCNRALLYWAALTCDRCPQLHLLLPPDSVSAQLIPLASVARHHRPHPEPRPILPHPLPRRPPPPRNLLEPELSSKLVIIVAIKNPKP
jgi:hypothetical protein